MTHYKKSLLETQKKHKIKSKRVHEFGKESGVWRRVGEELGGRRNVVRGPHALWGLK